MRLESMRVHGLRRFGGATPHKLRLDGKLVCIIGANEVGKSTLLDALSMARAEERHEEESGDLIAVDSLLLTRGEDIEDDRILVRIRYRLEEDDLALLRELPSGSQLTDVRWLERRLRVDGKVLHHLDPAPERDKGPRRNLARLITAATGSEHWVAEADAVDTPADSKAVKSMTEALGSRAHVLSDTVRNQLAALADWIDEQGEGALTGWLSESPDWQELAQRIREPSTSKRSRIPSTRRSARSFRGYPSSLYLTKGSVGLATSTTSRIPTFRNHCATWLFSLGSTFNGCTTRSSPVRPEPSPISSRTRIAGWLSALSHGVRSHPSR